MIPKVIHQISGPSANSFIKKCMSSWNKLEKYGYEIVVWNDESLESFIKTNFEFALSSFVNARNHAEAADIARYLIVYKFGGFYVDWDIELFNPRKFVELRNKNKRGYLLIDPSNNTLASEHFSAPPFEEFLLRLTEDIIETYNRDERDLMYTPQYSGPFRMRASMRRHQITKQVSIPVKDIFEYDYSEIRAAKEFGKNKVMVHYWVHSWC